MLKGLRNWRARLKSRLVDRLDLVLENLALRFCQISGLEPYRGKLEAKIRVLAEPEDAALVRPALAKERQHFHHVIDASRAALACAI